MVLARLKAPYHWLCTQVKKPLNHFLNSRSGPFRHGVSLDKSRVYIVPTRNGMIYSLLLLCLLLGAINYAKSLGFMLTFLLAALAIVAMLMTWRNLVGLYIQGMAVQPVYAGQTATFTIQIKNHDINQRYAIGVQNNEQWIDVVDVAPNQSQFLKLNRQIPKRGYFRYGRVKIQSEFPLGLFVAWTWVDLDMQVLAYPSPKNNPTPPRLTSDQAGDDASSDHEGLDEFSSLDKYREGDNFRHISWKMAARTDKLYSKKFTGGQPIQQWIDWETIAQPQLEKRLSIMTSMILNAQQTGRSYGLRLPGKQIQLGQGLEHQHACLQALALF